MLKQKHVFFGFAFLAALVPLYWAKAEADKMRDHMQELRQDVSKERKEIRTLEAELTYLQSYDRLQKSATESLGLVPQDGTQNLDLQDLDKVAPIHQTTPAPVDTPAPVANPAQSKENGGELATK